MKKISTIILSAILSAAAAFGQSVETTGFSPKTVRPNGVSNYTLVFKDAKGKVDVSQIPLPDGLRIVGKSTSQSYSIINGAMSNSTSVILSMQASKEGALTIPDWSLTLGNSTFKIKSATLTVDKNAPEETAEEDPMDLFGRPFGMGGAFSRQSAQQQSQRMQQARQQMQSFESNLKNNAKLEIKFPREKIFVGESVPCELIFSFDKSLVEQGFTLTQLLPEIKKADAFDCPAFSEKPTFDTTSDASRVLIKYNTAVTPLKAGTYDLDFSARGVFNRELRADDMMNMSIFDRMMSFGGGRQIPFEINMQSKKVVVSELPENGKPANFTGAIGAFSLESVTVEPDALTVGEPCSIFAKIIGVGNFPRIQEPKLDAGTDWKTYKAKSSFTDESNGLSNIGIKTFEYTAVPKKADLPYAPAVLFNYFDPVTEKYVEVKSQPIPVSVAPTGRSKRAKEKEAAAPEPAFDKIIETTAVTTDARLLSSPYFWGAQILILCAVIAFVAMRREALRRQNDKPYAKMLAYKKETAKYLSAASKDAQNGDFGRFFTDSRHALQFALAADNDREAGSLTAREAREIMSDKNFGENEIKSALYFFEGADAISFGGMDTSKLDMRELNDKLAKLTAKISKRK